MGNWSLDVREGVAVEGLKRPLAEGLALESRLFLEINASDDAQAHNAGIDRPS